MTVKECVLQTLSDFPNSSNEEIAAKVRAILNSDTNAKNISWYKWKLALENNITINTLSNDDEENIENIESNPELLDEDEAKFWSKAEDLILKYEEQKGATVNKAEGSPGYDILSKYPNGEERHIEVKSKKIGKKTWVSFTSNETVALLNDTNFWLYILEGTNENNIQNVVEVSRENLLQFAKIKMHARVSNLSGYQRNKINS